MRTSFEETAFQKSFNSLSVPARLTLLFLFVESPAKYPLADVEKEVHDLRTDRD